MSARLPPRLLALAAVLAAAACSIEVDDVAGRTCTDDSECPASYACVEGPDGQRGCEVIYPPRSTADSGTDAGTDAGS
ncbi:hypothetical protein [Myxococcus sp. RHSTA-1-4]|uniref:hypothetical protein n=1 Tax=Myxococcus sp. RHSTA-1-4 TaxID=2874601 RepID=UPI001CBD818D|nr:hypothetical protein [Myxococcus sp. RHSTA-1-4]MBZ4416369.1 hypothetical protein [Myxococcus sp. RHSTA-1-4]